LNNNFQIDFLEKKPLFHTRQNFAHKAKAMKRIRTGDIVKIPLWGSFGYAYARYIDISKFPSVSYPSLIEVYEYWTKTQNFEFDHLIKSNFLVQPILVLGINPTLRNGFWEIVKRTDMNIAAIELPHFRSHEPRWDVEENAKEWCYIRDCDSTNRVKTSYDNVKHLESGGAKGTGNIEIYLTMQVMKKEEINIEDHFDLNDETFRYQYNVAMKSPLVSEIPLELYGRAKQ